MLSTPADNLYLTEFSLYFVGIILLRRKMYDTFTRFVNDLLVSGGVRLLRLPVEDMKNISGKAQSFNLDFDDAYQYAAAEKYDLTIISFDSDFDRTERGRKIPSDMLKK